MREFTEVLLLAAIHSTAQFVKGIANAFGSLEHHLNTYWQRFGIRHDQKFSKVRDVDPMDELNDMPVDVTPSTWKKN